MDLQGIFTLSVLFALAGGFIGSLLGIDHARYGWFITGLLVLMGMVMAAAVSEHLLPPSRPWLSGAVGIFAGAAAGFAMDAFKAAAPGLAGRIIDMLPGLAGRGLDNLATQWLASRQKRDND